MMIIAEYFCSVSGSSAYDAYVICSKDSDDQSFLVQNMLVQLEKFYKLCIPDRDFLLGSGKNFNEMVLILNNVFPRFPFYVNSVIVNGVSLEQYLLYGLPTMITILLIIH